MIKPTCLAFTVFFFIISPGVLTADRLDDYLPKSVVLKKSNDFQLITVDFHGNFPLKVLSAIEDGIRVRLVCEILVKREINFILSRDEEVYRQEYSFLVSYDLMSGRYLIFNEGSGETARISRRRDLILFLLASKDYQLSPGFKVLENEQYYAEARVCIRFGKLYPPFSFLSIMNYESPWVRSARWQE